MAFNLTVEDSSPLVTYGPSGAWSDSPAGDSLLQSYSGGSLHTTSAPGATATIQFNGTGIWLFGGKRPNYGPFVISVDGQTAVSGNANDGTVTTKQLLGAVSSLEYGPHTVVLTNTGAGTAIDLDSFTFEAKVGTGSTVTNITINDSDPSIIYAPSSSDWLVNLATNVYIDNGLHFSSTAGASATIPFSGEAVAVYGTVSPDHANILVSLDGQTQLMQGGSGGFASELHVQTLLYYADNLGSGQHQLVLTSDQSNGAGTYLDLDAVTAYSSSGSVASSSGHSTTGTTPSGPDSSHAKTFIHSHNSSTATVIIAAAVGGTVLLLLLMVAFFFLFRRRRQAQARRKSIMISPLTPALPIQQWNMNSGLRSGQFSDVKLSPARMESPQFVAFPNSGNPSNTSYQSEKYDTMPEKSALRLQLQIPQQPPASITRRPAPNPDADLSWEAKRKAPVPPMRPLRPPSLLLSPQTWRLPGK